MPPSSRRISHDSSEGLHRSRPIQVERLRRESCTPTLPPAVHDHAVLVFMTQGHAVHEQRERFEIEAGDVLLIPAGEAHRLLRSTHATGWGIGVCASCYAPSEMADVFDPFERARSGASPVVRVPTARQENLVQWTEELYAETQAQHAHTELVQKSLLALILAEVSRASSGTDTLRPASTLLAQALQYIERNCLEPLTLSDVARAVGRSPSYLTTAVKRATGKSVVQWIIAGRLAEARNRLLHTDESIDVIAERVGYADTTHFIRLFRRTHGITPSAWRARQHR